MNRCQSLVINKIITWELFIKIAIIKDDVITGYKAWLMVISKNWECVVIISNYQECLEVL